MHPVSIKSVLKSTLKNLDLYDVYRRQRALLVWRRVCGKEVAEISYAEKLRGSVLFVAVRDHVWASELTNFKDLYLQKYAKLMGSVVVRDIRFASKPKIFEEKKKRVKKEFDIEEVSLSRNDKKKINGMLVGIEDEKTRQFMEKFLSIKARAEAWHRKHGGVECFGCGVMVEKGRTFCPHCLIQLERKNAAALREELESRPYVSFDEVSKKIVPISFDLYVKTRDSMRERLYGEIVNNIEAAGRLKNVDSSRVSLLSRIKADIVTFAMLASGKKPAQLNDEALREILSPAMYKFLNIF